MALGYFRQDLERCPHDQRPRRSFLIGGRQAVEQTSDDPPRTVSPVPTLATLM